MSAPTPNLKTLQIIFMSILMSPAILGGVLFVIPLEAQPDQQGLAAILGVVALGTVPMVLVARRVVMGDFALTAPDVPPGRMEVDQKELAQACQQALGRYQTGSIVGFAMAESMALFGFVAGFLTGNPAYALPFIAGSMALIAVQFPRASGALCLVPQELRAAAARKLGA